MQELHHQRSSQAFLLACLLHSGNSWVMMELQTFFSSYDVKFFLLCSLVLIKLVDDFVTLAKNLLFVVKFFIFNSRFHVECIRFK